MRTHNQVVVIADHHLTQKHFHLFIRPSPSPCTCRCPSGPRGSGPSSDLRQADGSFTHTRSRSDQRSLNTLLRLHHLLKRHGECVAEVDDGPAALKPSQLTPFQPPALTWVHELHNEVVTVHDHPVVVLVALGSRPSRSVLEPPPLQLHPKARTSGRMSSQDNRSHRSQHWRKHLETHPSCCCC